MSERVPELLIQGMLESVERIRLYIQGFTYNQFLEDTKTSDAVVRNLQVLGEAANKVPKTLRRQSSDIEWIQIIRSRHIVVHDYFGVDLQIVWRIATVHLPPLQVALLRL